MITILGNEFEFSFTDADNMLKWAETQEKLRIKHAQIAEYKTDKEYDIRRYAELLRDSCYVIFDLFDELLGEGTSNKLFGEKCDFEKCLDAYQELEEAFAEKSKTLAKKAAKYKPYGVKGAK